MFVFVKIAKSEEIPQIANLVRLLVDFFNKTNIAHNVFVTRGTPFEGEIYHFII